MFASELMEEVRENPDKYEKQVFEVTDGYALTSTGKSVPHIIISAGTAREGHTGNIAYFSTDTQVKEIKQPVTWQEAIQAWIDGKTIYSDGDYGKHFYLSGSQYLKDNENAVPITRIELQKQKWYIED